MSTRRERVVLTLDDKGFTTGMAKAAVATEALDGALDDVDGSMVDVDHQNRVVAKSNKQLGDSFESTGNKAQKASKGIDAYSGRLSMMATAAVTLGPALIPAAGVATAAVSSLTVALGGLAGGITATALAFSGVGDAMSALDAYQLEPTTENLEAMNKAFDDLGKTGEEFVRYLDSLEPAIDQLQKTARNGLFPGLEAGLKELETTLPSVNKYIGDMSTMLGDLAETAATELVNADDWQAFFDYMGNEGIATLDTFSRALGNFAAGISNTLVGLAPLTEQFTQGLYDMSREFRAWSASLSTNQGFQDFLDYSMQMMPEFMDMLGSLADLAYSVAQAFAPWSEIIVPAITAVADALSSLLSSPIGSAVATMTASMMMLNKANLLIAASGRKAATSVGLMGKESTAAAKGTVAVAAGSEKASVGVSKFGRAAGLAAGAGGLMLMNSELAKTDDTMGDLVSTVGAAAVGFAVGGPWGAAIGGAIGLLSQFGEEEREAAEAADKLTVSLDKQTGGFDEATKSQVNNQLAQEGAFDTAKKLGVSYDTVTQASMGNAKAQDDLNDAIARGVESEKISDEEGKKLTATVNENSKALFDKANHADQVAVANGKMSQSEADMRAEFRSTSAEIDYQNHSMKGMTDGAERNRQAVDGMVVSLGKYAIAEAKAGASNQELSKFIKQGENDLVQQAAQMGLNEKEVRAYVDALNLTPKKVRTAVELTDADVSAAQVMKLNKLYESLPPEVKTIIKQMGAKETAGLVLNLRDLYTSLPADVQTTVAAIGTDIANKDVENLALHYTQLPKSVRTQISEFGAAVATNDVQKLQEQYNLTPKQIKTIAELLDHASPKIKKVQKEIKELDGKTAKTKSENKDNASPKIKKTSKNLNDLDGKHAKTTSTNTDKASGPIRRAKSNLLDLNGRHARTTSENKDNASGPIARARSHLLGLNGMHARTTSENKDNASGPIARARSHLLGLDGMRAKTVITADDQASGVIASVTQGLAAIPREVTTVIKSVHKGAEGGLLLPAQTYAAGGMDRPNGHRPQIARPSPQYRVWAEPETKGEAYIPLANDHRRPRAKSILEQTAALLGGSVAWNANGSITPPPSTPMPAESRSITNTITYTTTGDATLAAGVADINRNLTYLAGRVDRVESAIKTKTVADDKSRGRHSDRNAQLTGASIGKSAVAGRRAQRYG